MEVVGNEPLGNGALHGLDDEVCCLVPAHVAEHHLPREDDARGVHLVLARILGRGSVGGLKDRMPRLVVDVGPWGDADSTHLGGQGIGDVVPVEVQGGDHRVLVGAEEDLLQEVVGDHVLDDDLPAGAGVFQHMPGAAIQGRGPVFLPGQGVAPFPEGPFRELHDVALVHQGDAGQVLLDGVGDGGVHQALRALFGDGLDSDPRGLWEADLGVGLGELPLEEVQDLLHLLAACRPLNPGIDVLGVLPEDDHVDQLGVLHRAGYPLEPAHGAHAGVKVQLLPQGHVDGADAPAHRGGQGPFDGHQVLADEVQGFLG